MSDRQNCHPSVTNMHETVTIHAQFVTNRMFRVFGHNKVWVLDGGLPRWRDSGFDLGSNSNDDAILKSKTANSAVEAVYNGEMGNTITFHAEFQPQLFWTLEKVAQNVASRTHQQVDARSKGRFDGVAPEPRKGVRSGHIPGSICVPFPEVGISIDHPIVPPNNISIQGLHRIGKHDIPVYDGSWTEWEAQPDSDYPKVTAIAS
ncbi:hypothetical protein PR202_ga06560 [Eleusine coracana subsp. coracana]|uniref:Rhodanese domain-containing protein n=1 Tax=Eleusine coracana subsp. coracana TaxID=191504 RepID=A0AAV5BXL4_ELECO|nr:hypothetical protein PR202_ga06560 [Eleusine coracana subsp. coracana]